jgi:regulatory protein
VEAGPEGFRVFEPLETTRKPKSARSKRKSPAQKYLDGEISEAEAIEAARESALRTLTNASKSRADLRAALVRKSYPAEIVDPLLDRFESVGLLNDADYASLIVRTRHNERQQSRRAIAMELRRRGIAEDTAADALASIDDDAERVAVEHLAEKLAARTAGLDEPVRMRRLVAALGRRGYSPGLSYEAAKAALAFEGD